MWGKILSVLITVAIKDILVFIIIFLLMLVWSIHAQTPPVRELEVTVEARDSTEDVQEEDCGGESLDSFTGALTGIFLLRMLHVQGITWGGGGSGYWGRGGEGSSLLNGIFSVPINTTALPTPIGLSRHVKYHWHRRYGGYNSTICRLYVCT
jgi:hypothetical protein